MNLQALQLHQFRSFADLELEVSAGFTVFVGPNGAGKTNILEAIYFGNALRSFRTSDTSALIAKGQEFCRISLLAQAPGDSLTTQLKVALSKEQKTVRKKLWIDDKPAKSSLSFIGKLPLIVFTPEDLSLVRGTPGQRRNFIDRAVFAHEPSHARDSQAYDKALRSRNHVLKQATDIISNSQRSHLLDSYDQSLAQYGTKIINRRIALVRQLQPALRTYFAAIHDTPDREPPFSLSYLSKSELQNGELSGEQYLEQISRVRKTDLIRRTTSVGPHLDDLRFDFAGNLAADHASQGQIRAMILALKLGELEILRTNTDQRPLLLLDDVTSELDPKRSAQFFSALPPLVHQCLITTTGEHFVPLPQNQASTHFSLASGRLIARNG